jgi:hypothetical protein
MTTPHYPHSEPHGQPPMAPVYIAYNMQPPEQHYATTAVPAQSYVLPDAPQSSYGPLVEFQAVPVLGSQRRKSARVQQVC